jgi:hypothetical protein
MIFQRAEVLVSVLWGLGIQALMAVGVYSFKGHTPTVLQTETEVAIPVAIGPAMPMARGANRGAVRAATNAQPPPQQREQHKSTDVDPVAKPALDAGAALAETAIGPTGTATAVSTNAADPVGPVAPTTATSGGDGDPLAAQQAGMYRGQLDAWFSARFQIRGKLPFDQLKNLRATVVVTVDASRQVTGFQIVKPSGDPIFDGELRRALSAAQSGAGTLPAPPESHPELLGTQVTLSFSCTSRARCE